MNMWHTKNDANKRMLSDKVARYALTLSLIRGVMSLSKLG